FFFQAEDGIRDRTVTGVQTCALPIYKQNAPRVEGFSVREALANRHILLVGVTGFIGKVWLVDLLEKIPNIGKITLLIRRNRTTRSEERRVGKECRSRWRT